MDEAKKRLEKVGDEDVKKALNHEGVEFDEETISSKDLRELAVKTLAETERIARRVLGGTHPLTVDIEHVLQKARAVLRARETPSPRGESA